MGRTSASRRIALRSAAASGALGERNDQTGTVYRAAGRREVRAGGVTALAGGPTGSVADQRRRGLRPPRPACGPSPSPPSTPPVGVSQCRVFDGTGVEKLVESCEEVLTARRPDGTNAAYAQFRDAAGNVRLRLQRHDRPRPRGPHRHASTAARPGRPPAHLTLASDVSGASDMRFSTDGDFDTETCEPYSATKSFTLAAGRRHEHGVRPVPRRGRQRRRHATRSASTGGPSGTVQINGGAAWTNLDGRRRSRSPPPTPPARRSMRFSTDGLDMEPGRRTGRRSRSRSPARDGTNTVYASTGTRRATLRRSDTIGLDTAAPSRDGYDQRRRGVGDLGRDAHALRLGPAPASPRCASPRDGSNWRPGRPSGPRSP